MRTLIFVGLVLLLCGSVEAMAGPGSGYSQRNAAYWYGEAFKRFDRLDASMPDAEMRRHLDRITSFLHDPSAPVSDELRSFLMRMDPALGMVRRAAVRDEHDFRLDYAQGPQLSLPHLRALRGLAKCLVADAKIQLSDEDPMSAARNLAAAYRMSEHTGRDRLVRSALTGQSICVTADRVTRYAIDAGQFGPSECLVLLEALRQLDGDDPFRLADGISSERAFSVPWYRDRYRTANGVEQFQRDFSPQLVDAHDRVAMKEMTPRGLDAELDAAAAAIEHALVALRLGDSARTRAELARLDREIRDGTHGLVASSILPGFRNMYDRMRRTVDALNSRRALLEQLADGRLDEAATANAALWYLRAGGLMESMSASDRERLRAFAEDPTQSIDAPLRAMLQRANPIINVLREASWIHRCDFERARPDHPAGVLEYHATMRDLVRLLQVDAVRCIRDERFTAATDRLAYAFRMTGHLGQDSSLISAQLAHESFEAIWALIRPGLDAEVFDARQRSKLVRSARGMGGSDPFGFEASLDRERRALRVWLRRQTPAAMPDARTRLDAMLSRCDAGQVFTLAVGAGWLEREASEASTGTASGGPLDGLVGPEAVRSIESRLPKLRELLDAGRVEALPEWATVSFSRLRWHGRGASQRVHRSIEALQAGAGTDPEPVPE